MWGCFRDVRSATTALPSSRFLRRGRPSTEARQTFMVVWWLVRDVRSATTALPSSRFLRRGRPSTEARQTFMVVWWLVRDVRSATTALPSSRFLRRGRPSTEARQTFMVVWWLVRDVRSATTALPSSRFLRRGRPSTALPSSRSLRRPPLAAVKVPTRKLVVCLIVVLIIVVCVIVVLIIIVPVPVHLGVRFGLVSFIVAVVICIRALGKSPLRGCHVSCVFRPDDDGTFANLRVIPIHALPALQVLAVVAGLAYRHDPHTICATRVSSDPHVSAVLARFVAVFVRAMPTRELRLFLPVLDPRTARELVRAAPVHVPPGEVIRELIHVRFPAELLQASGRPVGRHRARDLPILSRIFFVCYQTSWRPRPPDWCPCPDTRPEFFFESLNDSRRGARTPERRTRVGIVTLARVERESSARPNARVVASRVLARAERTERKRERRRKSAERSC